MNRYVDDVLLVANGIETTQVHYDDYNGNGVVNVADLVRMKRAFEKDETVTLAAEKYADRDGNGVFEAADIAGFREKLIGIADDFTGVIATENAIGAKLEPVITEESKDIAYLTTSGEYTDQMFTFTTDIDYSNEKPLTIGARMKDVTNTPTSAAGLTAALTANNVVLSAKGWTDTITESFELTEGESYLLSAKVTDNGDSTKTFTLVARQDGEVVETATCVLDKTHAGDIPASGAFAIWSADEVHDVMYQIVQDNELAVVIPKEAEDGIAVLTANSGTQEASNQAYLFVDGDYTTETFAFTMDVGAVSDTFAYIGLHKKAGHPTYFAQDGCHILLKDWGIAAYTDLGGTWREEVTSQYTAPDGQRVNLSQGVYTIKVHMEGNTIYVTIMKDGVIWSNDKVTFDGIVENPSGDYTKGSGYTVPKSGGFSIWRPYNQTGDLEIAYQMPYMTDTTYVQIDDDGDGGSALLTTKVANNTTKSAYFMLADKYTTEHFEVTTMLSDAENSNLQIGARMAGVSREMSANKGVIVNVAKDQFTVLQDCTQIGNAVAWSTELNTRINYTFRVSISSDNILTIKVLQGSTVVNEATVNLSSDSLAASGYFAVWSQAPYRQIEHRLLLAGTDSLIIQEPNNIGSVLLKRSYTELWNKAYLALEGAYTTETFEVTTSSVYTENQQLYVGLRCSGTHVTDGKMEGIYVGLAANFFTISGTTGDVSWAEASQNYKNMNGNKEPLVEGVEYTFSFSLSKENVLTISVKQDGEVVRTNTVILDGVDRDNKSYTLPSTGGLRVRTLDSESIFTYKISE